MQRLIKSLALVCMLPFAGSAFADESTVTVESLRAMSQTELNSAYLNVSAVPGEVPNGDSQGTAVFFPGSILNTPTQMLAGLAWQGKVFDTENGSGVLNNKVFGFNAIKAEVFYGPSLFDGKRAIIIDYSRTSIVAGRIRDEIRQVAPKLYLGRAYLRGILLDHMIVNFILDFNK